MAGKKTDVRITPSGVFKTETESFTAGDVDVTITKESKDGKVFYSSEKEVFRDGVSTTRFEDEAKMLDDFIKEQLLLRAKSVFDQKTVNFEGELSSKLFPDCKVELTTKDYILRLEITTSKDNVVLFPNQD